MSQITQLNIRNCPGGIIALLILGSFGWTCSAADKHPAPTTAKIAASRRTVRTQFRSEFSRARKPEQKGTLAQTLIDKSDGIDDLDLRFTMLYEASVAAAQAGQSVLSMSALQQIDKQFKVDLLPMKVDVLSSFPSPESLNDASILLGKYQSLSDEAVAAEDYETAVAALQEAADALKKPAFRGLRNVAMAERRQMAELQDAFKEARPAREKLKQNPEDAVANLAWGHFVCFYKEDVEAGIELFSKADDAIWKPIAQAEKNPDKNPNDWIKLGDAWFQAGNRKKDPVRAIALNRADRAWQTAFDVAPAAAKGEVAANIDSRFVKLFGSSFVATNGNAAGATLPRTERLIPGDQFTAEFWVSTVSNVGTLLSKSHRQGEASSIAHIDNGTAALGVKRGNGEGGSGSSTLINDGLWHHVAVVKTADEIVLYVDGQRGAQTNSGGDLVPSNSPWKFGSSVGRPGCAARFGGVRISDIARYDSDFSPKKVHFADLNTLFAP